jgi:DNA-binding CsgD family transcriptional regulator
LVVLSDPVQELTPGALSALYRYFGLPSQRDLLPSRVRRWLNTAHEPGADRLELARPLRAELDGRELVIRLLPASRGRSESILIDEQGVDVASETLRGVGLTEREATVLRLLGSGMTNSAIAAELDLSPWTVKRHLANIYTKLGVSGRVRASALAIEIAAHHRPAEG